MDMEQALLLGSLCCFYIFKICSNKFPIKKINKKQSYQKKGIIPLLWAFLIVRKDYMELEGCSATKTIFRSCSGPGSFPSTHMVIHSSL